MNDDSAYFLARKALSFNTYDPDANFEYRRSARQLSKQTDALDGFEIAAITTYLRSAACTEISKRYFIQNNYEKSAEYAVKSLINNQLNIEGSNRKYGLRIYYNKTCAVWITLWKMFRIFRRKNLSIK